MLGLLAPEELQVAYIADYSQQCEAEGIPTSQLRDDGYHSEAVLTDSSLLLRICGSRPGRMIPAAIKVKRAAQRISQLFNHHSFPFRHYGNRYFSIADAIIPMPQCDYYVFALRRLLC